MKVSNRKYIKALNLYLYGLILLDFMVLALHFLIFKKADFFIFILFFLSIALFTLLYKLDYIQFENSGLVITIRKRSLFKERYFEPPSLEFPLDLLEEFYIRNNTLYLKIKNNHYKNPNTFKIPLAGFNMKESRQILSSLSKIIN